MNFWNDLKSALKGTNKICDPLLIYIILGIFKFFILYLIYLDFTTEGFAPVHFDNNNNNNNNNKCPHCNGDDSSDCKYCNGGSMDKFHLVMVINFMLYLYVIFGMFLQLLCKNNMKNAAWFIILYPFISKLVWMMII